MTLTRHISLNDDHIEKMKPFVEKHNGNFSNALREMINRAGKYSPRMNSSAIDTSLLNWAISETAGILMPDNILDETINPRLINSISNLEDHLKHRFSELGWDIDIVLKYDTVSMPSDVLIEIRGSPQKIRFAAGIISQYLVKNSLVTSPLEIRSVIDLNENIKVELIKSNKKDAIKSLQTFFGDKDEMINIIKSRPIFWKSLISRHLLSNYNMVTIHRNYFEDMLANKIPLGEIMIENLAKKPIQEIPLKKMLSLIKDVYDTSRVADRVEVDNDTISFVHSFRNSETIEKLKTSLVSLLESNGHLYEACSVANMIVLRHRPDVGTKINEIVDTLKTSSSTVDQELILFMAFLKGIKDLPDIPLSLTALGRRIGKALMKEYEIENNIKRWGPETFQKALEVVDSKLHRESAWKVEGDNMLYSVKNCRLAREDNSFDNYVCHTARETFKGAMNYAFGNRAELEVRKLVNYGDNFCEVMIRLQ